MENQLGKMMMPFKVQQLLDVIIDKRGLEVEDALQYLYSSDLYENLSSEDSYLWQLSTHNLYDLLKKEKRTKKNKEDNAPHLLLFISFCIENYKEHINKSAKETLFLFNKYNVIDYLKKVFDTLHTQSKEYIMNEIDTYIGNRKD